VSIDTHGFKPEDLQVKVQNNIVSISAKHEEKTSQSNSKSYSSRQLSKSFTLPQGCKMDTVSSHLSKDGLLIISAPKPNANSQGAPRKIQIQTGPLDEARTAPEENNSAPRYRLVGSKLIKPKFIDH
jgi:crystallin alpha B